MIRWLRYFLTWCSGGTGGKGRNSSQNTEQQKADQQKRRPLKTPTRLATKNTRRQGKV
jgi:hypothetical protein